MAEGMPLMAKPRGAQPSVPSAPTKG
jgi:hypothetical protein